MALRRWTRFVERRLERLLTRVIEDAVESAVKKYFDRTTRPYLDIKEVAWMLKVSKRKVEQLVTAGDLVPCWVGGQRRFHRDAVDAYMHRS